jgi:hypothetical protein
MTKRQKLMTAGAIALALGVAGCGSDGDESGGGTSTASSTPSGLPQGSEHVAIDPAEFTTNIDNTYWPMVPGSRWVYSEEEDGARQRVVVTVTNDTKTIDGVETRVVHDVVSAHGVTVEDTHDWYAQDSVGNIWYFGEDTTEYKHGKPASTQGSFEAGVDGAEPGIALPAEPATGMAYREEFKAGDAEDQASVLSTDAQVEVPFGHFRDAVLTSNTNPLEPKIQEYKLYAKDVGPVMELLVSGGSGRTELLSYTHG